MPRFFVGNLLFFFFAVSLGWTPAALPSESRPNIQVEVIARGLETPWAIAFASDGRLFVTERPGRIRVVKDGKLQQESWLEIAAYETGEAGLLGLAVDPGFERSRFLYAAYSYRDSGGRLKNRLVRLRDDPSSAKGVIDRVLLDDAVGSRNHDGGRVKFGSDGKLYWTVGDAQNTSFSQNTSSLNGKILRLNPDGTVFLDNPFAQSPVYSYGHRNPQGLAWQPGS